MKKVAEMVFLLFLISGGCLEKNVKKESVYWDKKKTIKYWNGESVNEFEGKTMAAMLWLRPKISQEPGDFPAKHQIYKRFDDDDYKIFWDCLKNPDKSRPSYVKGISGLTSTLYLSFLDGSRYIVFFSLEHETSILPNGFSKKIYTLFIEKEESSAYDPQKDPTLEIRKSPMSL
jgi:hypothetical protein